MMEIRECYLDGRPVCCDALCEHCDVVMEKKYIDESPTKAEYMAACDMINSLNSTINSLEGEIHSLVSRLCELQNDIDLYKKELEHFTMTKRRYECEMGLKDQHG